MKKGLLIVISGASGTGKGTVCKELLARETGIAYSVSATSRAPREGEEDGREYYFRTREEFEQMIADGAFLEYADVYGNYYGTPLAPIEKRRAAGEDILLEIDTQGALDVMDQCPDGTFIFLLPPSLEELSRRITGRGTESEESLVRRLAAARDEILLGKRYRYAVLNDTVEAATDRIQTILAAERLRADMDPAQFEI
ncbi:guanylate kinase [Selenomonas sp. oral taxon 892 str. F0426]|uniref:guanylate kinase n=1 Tax=Selenomonas sp. oral taxon 892 TaxID=1321785 RepID=UPI0003AD06F6|nr:guanylate kinase [Selenomonas sp. oral taxon 892]ERJ95537.1 guanylate kinase [Selenomonas sp. oral taxon 892 str. F0426]